MDLHEIPISFVEYPSRPVNWRAARKRLIGAEKSDAGKVTSLCGRGLVLDTIYLPIVERISRPNTEPRVFRVGVPFPFLNSCRPPAGRGAWTY